MDNLATVVSATEIPPVLVSVEDAATALGIRRTKAWDLVRAGKLRTVRIGTRRLVPARAIDEFVAELASEDAR